MYVGNIDNVMVVDPGWYVLVSPFVVLADHGVDLSKPTVAMCHCGMSSCILVLLAHILGHNIKLYLVS